MTHDRWMTLYGAYLIVAVLAWCFVIILAAVW